MPKTRTLPIVRTLLLFLIALSGFRARAGRGDGYGGNTWALLDPKSEQRAAASITRANYPNCDEATVDERSIQVYQADGTGESQDETYTKILTEMGRRDHDVVTVDFLIPYSQAEVVCLEIMRPDGRVIPVDVAANSKVSIDNHQMRENIYDPNSRVLQVNVPKLVIGDILHTVTRCTTLRPVIPGSYSDEFLLEGAGYIRHASTIIEAPANWPLKHVALRDEVPGTVTYSIKRGADGTFRYDWELAGVPRMYGEPSMPPYETALARLLVSTVPDWESVSRWYWDLSERHLDATNPEMKRTVLQLTAGAAAEIDRIRAIFFYVSKQIRYMGVTSERDRPGFEPHDASLTFGKKYGVCRDKAALLVAMLRMAGVKAYPVLINVGAKLDREIPSPSFNHAIVAVEWSRGKYQLMDPTDEHTRVLRPAYDDNRSYLVCRSEGETLKVSPVSPPSANMMRIATTGVLSGSGTLDATSVLSFGGVNDDEYRGVFADMKPDDRRRFFESRLQRVVPGARIISLHLTPEKILDESTPLRAEIRFSAHSMAAFGAAKAVVSVPWIGRAFGLVNYILDGTGLERRKYPLETQVTCGIDESIALRLADNFTRALSLPSSAPIDDGCVGYRRGCRFGGHALDCSEYLELKTVEFSPEQYLGLKRMLKDIEYDERKAPVMAAAAGANEKPLARSGRASEPPADSDAEVLQDRQEMAVVDAHSAVLTVSYEKKILTYAGKIREAEVKIPYNPSTEKAELLRAVVISGTGARQEVSGDELNVMDAAWNASARRYTGGKILVASLPGVEIGSTIEVEYRIIAHGRQYLAGFVPFQLADNLVQKSFRITAPAGVDVLALVTGKSGAISEEKDVANGVSQHAWSSRNAAALVDESDLPPDWSYLPGVEYFVGKPASYLKALDSAMLERSRRSAKARQLALGLAAKAKTRRGAVQAIRDYVAEFIRLTDPAFTDLPLSELSDADITLAEGYGNAADRAILLHAMLAAAGFRPEFVLASDLPDMPGLAKIASSFPLPGAFAAPLVRVGVEGQIYCLNDTNQYARLGSTPHDGRMAITLSDGSRFKVRAAEGCATKVATDYRLSLADDGNTKISIEHRYFGMAYADKNRLFSELPPERKNRYYQEAVSKVAQGARALGGLVTKFGSYPGVERFTVEVSRYAIADGGFLYFDLPFEPCLFRTETDRRILPLFVPQDLSNEIRVQIAAPARFRRLAISPKDGCYREPDGAGTAGISTSGGNGNYTFSYRLETRPAIIPPADYPAARDLESTLENKAARVFLLESGGGPLDRT